MKLDNNLEQIKSKYTFSFCYKAEKMDQSYTSNIINLGFITNVVIWKIWNFEHSVYLYCISHNSSPLTF